MSPKIESLLLDIDGLTIAAIRQRNHEHETALRMLCLHGWLDNANSFIPMMPDLPDVDLVAIDLPGHGFSAHLGDNYSYTHMMLVARKVLIALDWQDCVLMGHSLGGTIAMMLAVAAPEVVTKLISIEACGPLSETPDAWPDRLRAALAERLEPGKFDSRTFASPDEAVQSRLRAAKMKPMSARLIIDRQLQMDEDGLRWRFDAALRYRSWLYHNEDHIRAALGSIECPTLVVIADEGYLAHRDETALRLACIPQLDNVTLAGHHHLHMDTPEPVATAVNAFLGTRPALGG